ncbi:MAG: cellulase family glycosylhydrolase [Bryobacteraceae bacterium]|nr:cellulase family glycosylhydrolase [Bryobacteraceae bacterium]
MKRIAVLILLVAATLTAQDGRWTAQKANQWYAKQPWLVGANYIPSTAINELEMWQAATFNPARIDEELAWAESIGMNTMRVFLHDLMWKEDREGFRERLDQFLAIADRHKIKPMLVLFDSCWDPFPRWGKQRAPKPGVHNSGWLQSPGLDALKDPGQHSRLEGYVKGVIAAFAKDKRILAWDLWNEPENTSESSYGKVELPNKADYVLPLLEKSFEWARAVNPTQPLTSGVWKGDWSGDAKLSPIQKVQLEQSDVISFHNYDGPEKFEAAIQSLQRYKRPILCTEYMARGNMSTFQGSLPVAKKYNVAAYNWGLVQGKTQTHLPWDSWQKPYVDREPAIWFHEVFKTDGTPYKPEEVDLIRGLTGRGKPAAKKKAA